MFVRGDREQKKETPGPQRSPGGRASGTPGAAGPRPSPGQHFGEK